MTTPDPRSRQALVKLALALSLIANVVAVVALFRAELVRDASYRRVVAELEGLIDPAIFNDFGIKIDPATRPARTLSDVLAPLFRVGTSLK